MKADTRIQMFAAVVLALSALGAVALAPVVAAVAGQAQLGYADRAEEGDPPEVALGVALGAFRGLFVNVLWFRAHELKQQGRFHEAVELSRAITKLQPRFPRVWGFHAWNMAYNISVATRAAEERWQWVDAGVRLLRSEGIPRNPNDMQIHRELAWIFIHKIQGINDDAHHHYKRELAREWHILLGPPPRRAETVEESIERHVLFLEQFAEAHDTMEELLADVPQVKTMIRRFREEAGVEPDFNLLRRYELGNAMGRAYREEGVQVQLVEDETNVGFDRIMSEIMTDEDLARAFFKLINHVRKRILVTEYNMEPQRMIRYTRLYGPLDWRHPAAHSLYWATRGVSEGLQRVNIEDFDRINTDRIILHSIQELFRWGTIYYDLLNDSYVQMIDLDYSDRYGQIMLGVLEDRVQAGEAEDPDRFFRLYAAGYENFLRDLVRIYYRVGDFTRARRYLQELRTGEWRNIHQPIHQLQELESTLEEFIVLDMKERITAPDFAQSEVVTSLRDAFLRGLLRGDMELFERSMRYASEVHRAYMTNQAVRTISDGDRWRMEAMDPRFAYVAAEVLVSILASENIGTWQASRMYRTIAQGPLRGIAQAAYEPLVAVLKPHVEDFDQWFPEPPGMDEFRAQQERMREEDRRRRSPDLPLER
ncbi:MAG: hypothetical protein EA376_02970 [Phycisphaeraceae bacterium]|nr:MAG: hypothetical protein EA376_02970 [Phycisphaeraceae bacterium]